MTSDEIRIGMSPATINSEMIKVKITPGFEEELKDEAEREGYSVGAMLELSAGTELAILGIQFLGAAGGLHGFAAVLRAFFEKNKGKRIVVSVGDTSIAVEGMSSDQAQEAMLSLLDQVEQQQRQLDESWDRVNRELDGS